MRYLHIRSSAVASSASSHTPYGAAIAATPMAALDAATPIAIMAAPNAAVSSATTPATPARDNTPTANSHAGANAPKSNKRMKISSMSSEMYLPPKRVGNANEADTAIMAEIDSYTHICATFDASQYVDPKNDDRYDILRFWDAHKKILPIHYHVFLGDCGSKRASSASVETVYSGKYCPLLPPDPSPMPTPSKPCLLTLGRCYQDERQGLPTGRQ